MNCGVLGNILIPCSESRTCIRFVVLSYFTPQKGSKPLKPERAGCSAHTFHVSSCEPGVVWVGIRNMSRGAWVA